MMKMTLKILLVSVLFGSLTQIAYATPWKDDAKQVVLESCIGHATSDPRITAKFTFEQIHKTCVCVQDYYDYTYSHEQMMLKLHNYTDAVGAEIAEVTSRCLIMTTNIGNKNPNLGVRPKTPLETMKAL